jgi:tryptophanyl-tRNA synthetase
MTQDIAGKFNRGFKRDVFPEPTYRLSSAPKVPGTNGEKMSKSYNNTIEIFAEGKPLKQAVMGIKTDSTPLGNPLDPERCTVFALYSLFASDAEREEMAARYRAGSIGYGDAKKALLGKIESYFGPARERRKELAARPDYVEDVLRQGARKARAAARETMALVREAVGMTPHPVV